MSTAPAIRRIQHIPILPDHLKARELLQRLSDEFSPIVEKRNWTVLLLTEMCCCDDGQYHCNNNNRSSSSGGGRKRLMGKNVHGFNIAKGDARTSLSIHIRLRDPNHHTLFKPYEELSHTMAHELAHIQIGPHSAEFYELMNEIVQQYEKLMIIGLVLDKDGFPMGSSQAYRLGGVSNPYKKYDINQMKRKAAEAAQKRQKLLGLSHGSGNMLGGGIGSKSCILSSREASLQAAERRLKDAQWCVECAPFDKKEEEDFIIEILSQEEGTDASDSSSSVINKKSREKESHHKLYTKKRFNDSHKNDGSRIDTAANVSTLSSASRSSTMKKEKSTQIAEVIDLLEYDDDDNVVSKTIKERINIAKVNKSKTNSVVDNNVGGMRVARPPLEAILDDINDSNNDANDMIVDLTNGNSSSYTYDTTNYWSCKACASKNQNSSYTCILCNQTRKKNYSNSMRRRDEAIEKVKANETGNALDTFGFNIYGTGSAKSSKMKHLT